MRRERPLQLIIGSQIVANARLRRIPGGIEAQLAGDALKRLIDATFIGGSIEVLDGTHRARGLDVTDIRMGGASTTVTLKATGARSMH
ncbi:hypothetical protein JMM59_16440 [Rhodovulum sulfidophilum]|nr:hypothetical protein [Rhodovulum sulfidophilum]MBL3566583.1 hypothetical protein [Rhodovulum sulfidophilum]MBL3572709.1 hypothetical protein [Rhodovulum sulfidophilum]